MTTIAVNLGAVAGGFEDLPIGSYLGEVTKAKLIQPRAAGKFHQLMVTYMVIDGDHTNRRQNHFMSFSPNALGFMKEFFSKFGLGDLSNLEFDPDTEELIDPDIVGSKVIFKVTQDKKDADRTRVSLTSVEENTAEAAYAPPVSNVVKPAKPAKVAPVEEAADEPAEDPAAAKAAAKAARIAAAQAALEAAAADDDDEDEDEPAAPAPAARTAAPRPAAAPARRTLR